MLDLRQLVAIILLFVNGLWTVIRSGCNYATLEERLQVLGQQFMGGVLVLALEKMDAQILATRDQKRYQFISFRKRTGVTIFGEFTLKRRLYRDRYSGAYHFLLDEALGWPSFQRLSPKLRETALDLATEMPFRKAARIISRFVPGVSAMGVWKVTRQAGKAAQQEGETLRQSVFEDGVVPEGKHRTRVLFLEADGVLVNQQRSPKKRTEVRLLAAYDGKKTSGSGRRSLEHRLSVASTRDAESFWEEGSARLANQWQLDKIERVDLGGDGASWVKAGCELFPNTVYHLDSYHLRRSLTEALSFSSACYQATVQAIAQKDLPALTDILEKTAKANPGAKRDKIKKLRNYLLDNWDGIIAQLPEDGLGVIEGQVRHTIARRMKRIGARWSFEGTDRMARLLAARANEELFGYMAAPKIAGTIPLARAVGETPIDRDSICSAEDLQDWLKVHVPALDTSSLTGCYLRRIINAVADLT